MTIRNFIFYVLTLLFHLPTYSWAQADSTGVHAATTASTPHLYLYELDRNEDTVLVNELDEVVITAEASRKARRNIRRYSKLKRNIRVTMPYARMCAQEMERISQELDQIENKKEREAHKEAELKRLRAEFEDDLKDLTFSQGHLLIKLIDRETGKTSYNLIKDFRNGFSAIMWQGFAKVFGMNLKEQYDPEKHQDIERALRELGYS